MAIHVYLSNDATLYKIIEHNVCMTARLIFDTLYAITFVLTVAFLCDIQVI